MKPCDNCRSYILPNTTHEPTRDEIGGGICTVHYAPAKPHLRLHYVTSPLLNDVRNPYPWYVVFVRGPFPIAGSGATYHHSTAAKAVRAAGVVWWGLPTGRYA